MRWLDLLGKPCKGPPGAKGTGKTYPDNTQGLASSAGFWYPARVPVFQCEDLKRQRRRGTIDVLRHRFSISKGSTGMKTNLLVRRVLSWMDPRAWTSAEPAVLLLMRLFVGAFLIWGVWDNIVDAARMAEFASFLRQNGFRRPDLLAPTSVWVQLAVGIGFVLGAAIRWAGILCTINFIIAVVMVDLEAGLRAAFPAAMLSIIGLYYATRGAGPFSLDAMIRGRRDGTLG